MSQSEKCNSLIYSYTGTVPLIRRLKKCAVPHIFPWSGKPLVAVAAAQRQSRRPIKQLAYTDSHTGESNVDYYEAEATIEAEDGTGSGHVFKGHKKKKMLELIFYGSIYIFR